MNNVAIHYDHPQYFALVPPLRIWELLHVNVIATTVVRMMATVCSVCVLISRCSSWLELV